MVEEQTVNCIPGASALELKREAVVMSQLIFAVRFVQSRLLEEIPMPHDFCIGVQGIVGVKNTACDRCGHTAVKLFHRRDCEFFGKVDLSINVANVILTLFILLEIVVPYVFDHLKPRGLVVTQALGFVVTRDNGVFSIKMSDHVSVKRFEVFGICVK